MRRFRIDGLWEPSVGQECFSGERRMVLDSIKVNEVNLLGDVSDSL